MGTSVQPNKGDPYCSLVFGLLLVMGVQEVGAYPNAKAEQEIKQKLTDAQIILALSSQDEEQAHQAVEEVMQRGERMIPLLMRTKGNNQAFNGYGLGNHLAAFLLLSPTGDKKFDEGRVITVEVAALYLISAIYSRTLEFAEAPYLTDGSPVEWTKFNTPKRVAVAWASVEKWAQVLKTEGLDSMRAKQYDPLKGSVVRFWGSGSLKIT